jgi:hypothetical protein
MTRVLNSIGVPQVYGPQNSTEGLPASVSTYGHIKQLVITFDYADVNDGLPRLNSEVDASVLRIPANSYIKSALLYVQDAFTSGGSATLQLGSEDVDGSADDADGLDSLAVAALTVNSWHTLDGALVGASSGDEDVQVAIDQATADFTAGKGVLVVEYVPPLFAEAP